MNSRRPFHPTGYVAPAAPYSAVIESEGLVFVSGQVPLDPSGRVIEGGIREHTLQVHENLKACLEAAGCAMSDVLKVTVYVARPQDFPAFNEIYRTWFDDPLPARTAIQAGLRNAFLVEVDVIARRSQQR